MKTFIKGGVVLLMITSLLTQVSAAVFGTNLSLGVKNNEVKKVQEFLIAQNFLTGSSTNYFGTQTKKAVQAFQKKNGLPPTGSWALLTRKKAESILALGVQSTSSLRIVDKQVMTAQAMSTSSFTTTSNKNVVLTISTVGYGYVLSTEDAITCYDNETCKKTFPVNKKITLQATPKEGYIISGWSEASCGSAPTCSVTLIEDTTVYARFEVRKVFKPTGTIMSLAHPKDTCYIPLGAESCDMRLTWVNNSGLDMTIKKDDTEYYLAIEDSNTSWKTDNLDPEDLAKATAENVSGPIYFGLSQGAHTISLKSNFQTLDTVAVDVKCAANYVWDGAKCWEKGASLLYVFKANGVVIKSTPSGINCGYHPEKCRAGFSSTTMVTLKAVVTPGRVFDGWTGGCSGKEPTCSILMNKDTTVGVIMR